MEKASNKMASYEKTARELMHNNDVNGLEKLCKELESFDNGGCLGFSSYGRDRKGCKRWNKKNRKSLIEKIEKSNRRMK